MGAFMVNGQSSSKYSVTLFPKETCSCPATSRCYHIMAAMLSIGMDIPNEKKVFNLTQLRKNCRPKHSRKCGTKEGGTGDNDFEVVAAPDSVSRTVIKNTFNTPKTSQEIKQKINERVKKNLQFENSTPIKNQKTPNTSKPSSGKRKCENLAIYADTRFQN